MSPPPRVIPSHFTYDDYVALPDDGKRYELFDGDLLVMPTPLLIHQLIIARLAAALQNQLAEPGIAEVFPSPVDVWFDNLNVAQPDIVVARLDRKELFEDPRRITGAPDLLVEVLSKSTWDRDIVVKRHLYARFGVREYWTVDPKSAAVELYRLVDTGLERHLRFDAGARMSSLIFPEVDFELAPVFKTIK